ncbi:hypothetical protein [Flavobacterium capsici]|uniref:Uncharacterized protein n=1 Tax=Flavobacterium capsici TaxID=3075618 RepID=A0AA96EVI7_9FLAO|nr:MULTISPECIES: hypothetical protein [unclassified Flavobacterium]WNM18981.1 hypothetical protein RN608_13320 [Flavobacterium sp. PMR2A8]WNM23031.1 hypothetical protein RN605_06620 [Flavobacterium sp. PMTSA4]
MSLFKKILKFLGLEVYTISLQSFKEQFGNMMEMEWKEVKVKSPDGMISKYKTFPINEIRCKNDEGKEVILKIKPSIEMRVTYSNNKKSVFYFDKIKVENNTISGSQSRIFGFITKEIHFRDITKIEIQDGRKQFKYV